MFAGDKFMYTRFLVSVLAATCLSAQSLAQEQTGFKTPEEAKNGVYIDKKCPFTSNVCIRGRIFKGVVLSTKMHRTVVLRRDYLHYIKKYNRFEKRHHNLPAHLSPVFQRTRIGDVVTVGQCRPISKTVRFNVLRVEKKRVEGNVRKTFVMF